ncbi:alanine aminotransferase 2-like [Megalops cyprinoides]|uniref:alanine aminotransferase 2-like n=1 Tax=Megalops cyprinoides TaxID=118141 RepID=UPI001865314D|nr:alanine aminotransferase 2-like [Megalops cyprinoides]
MLREISPRVRRILPSEQENLIRCAARIRTELQQGVKKPYKDLIDVSWGDAHRLGMKPLSFVRQVIAACLYPALLQSGRLPIDAQQRAQRLMAECEGGSVGSYTASRGIPHVQRSVTDFIFRRDGGVPSNPENIFIFNGSQCALSFVLKLLAQGEGLPQTAVLTPVPTYQTFTMALAEQGVMMVPYQLCEEEGWALKVEELRRVLRASRGHCSPRALYVINPGNPTGHVQSRKSIEEVIRFAAEEKLFLMADEVYQGSVHGEESVFVSYKKVLFEMGQEYSDSVELASFHSVSKGFMGECGLRGGYVELVNLDPAVMGVAHMLLSTMSSSAVIGQIALDILTNPPQPGDPSYPSYSKEVRLSQDTLVRNMRLAQEVLGGLPGVSCQVVWGGIYVFPRLHLPPRAVELAKKQGVEADLLYCSRLLEEAGVCAGPGCEHGQKEGTYHLRFCVMTPPENLEEMLRRLKTFHIRFLSEFS